MPCFMQEMHFGRSTVDIHGRSCGVAINTNHPSCSWVVQQAHVVGRRFHSVLVIEAAVIPAQAGCAQGARGVELRQTLDG